MISTKEILTYSITAVLLFVAAHMSPWLVLGIYLCMVIPEKMMQAITTNNTSSLPWVKVSGVWKQAIYPEPQGLIDTDTEEETMISSLSEIESTIETPASKPSKPTKRPKRITSPKTVEQETTPKKRTRRSTKN
jgi:hypothetical protein